MPRRIHRVASAVLCGLVVVVLLTSYRATNAAEQIAVALNSGRVFVGEVDPQSNANRLWLRTESGGMTLRRPIDWDSIVLAETKQKEFTPAALRASVDTLKDEASIFDEPDGGQAANSLSLRERVGVRVPDGALQSDSPAPSPCPLPRGEGSEVVFSKREGSKRARSWQPDSRLANYIQANRSNDTRVCSLAIDANVTNFNRTVEADGIVLHVYPLDGLGRLVSVDGTLDVELIAMVPPGARQGTSLPQIGRWTVRVLPEQFGPAGAVFKLPFRAVQPEFDLNVGPYGLVHATLNVPGNGSFEASDSMLRIRPYSAVRDEEQQLTGRRFFDVERVERWGR
ncbi:MAG TPA: hypothetical protein VGJ15_05170 [Pirellulales bacterium]|jgi:hypothetical protein